MEFEIGASSMRYYEPIRKTTDLADIGDIVLTKSYPFQTEVIVVCQKT